MIGGPAARSAQELGGEALDRAQRRRRLALERDHPVGALLDIHPDRRPVQHARAGEGDRLVTQAGHRSGVTPLTLNPLSPSKAITSCSSLVNSEAGMWFSRIRITPALPEV